MTLDIQDFKDAGFNEGQAKLLAKALSNKLHRYREEDIITKKDLALTEQKLRSDIQEVRFELKDESHTIQSELRSDISNSKIDIIKWMLSLFITTIISIGAMVSPLWLNKDVTEVSKVIANIKK